MIACVVSNAAFKRYNNALFMVFFRARFWVGIGAGCVRMINSCLSGGCGCPGRLMTGTVFGLAGLSF